MSTILSESALEKALRAEELSRKAAELHTAVGRVVAKVAQEIADELYEMARKLKDSLGEVELEQETPASESSETELFAATYAEEEESVKSAIEEVERLLTELVKLKGHEVVDDHSCEVEADPDCDYFINACQANAYGLIDEVIDYWKPGLVAPVADTTPPPKTSVWDLWKVEGSRKALKNMPSGVESRLVSLQGVPANLHLFMEYAFGRQDVQNGNIGGEVGDVGI
nr:ATP-dependent Clp protease proteolytic subunit 3, chloroplastic [Tanacetum cinerariifolium]